MHVIKKIAISQSYNKGISQPGYIVDQNPSTAVFKILVNIFFKIIIFTEEANLGRGISRNEFLAQYSTHTTLSTHMQ